MTTIKKHDEHAENYENDQNDPKHQSDQNYETWVCEHDEEELKYFKK